LTEHEFEIMRLEWRITVLEMFVISLFDEITPNPHATEEVLSRLNEVRNLAGRVSFPGSSAEESDLIAAEMQEAFDSLFASIKSHLKK